MIHEISTGMCFATQSLAADYFGLQESNLSTAIKRRVCIRGLLFVKDENLEQASARHGFAPHPDAPGHFYSVLTEEQMRAVIVERHKIPRGRPRDYGSK